MYINIYIYIYIFVFELWSDWFTGSSSLQGVVCGWVKGPLQGVVCVWVRGPLSPNSLSLIQRAHRVQPRTP